MDIETIRESAVLRVAYLEGYADGIRDAIREAERSQDNLRSLLSRVEAAPGVTMMDDRTAKKLLDTPE